MRWLALALALLIAGPATAQTGEGAIERARAALATATKALGTARGGRERLVALGTAVAAHEAALAAYREAMRAMRTREAEIRREIDADGARLQQVFGALQSLSQAPRSALLVTPGGPVAALRSAALAADITPQLEARVAALRLQLETLEELRAGQDTARAEVKQALATLQQLRADTDEAVRRNRKRGMTTVSELRGQAEAAAARARSLAELAGALGAAAPGAARPLVSFSEARGLIQLPVQGEITARFGERDPWGRKGAGLTLTAPAFAQVAAPWDGTVRYAGPLIDYGQVVILEPEPETLIVLAGLANVDREVGETVLAGERLGDLGGPIPNSDEFLLEGSLDGGEIARETLYIELRRNGKATDPADWFDLSQRGNGG